MPTIGRNAQIPEKEIVIKGEIDTTFLISKANECEAKMELITKEIAQFETLQTDLYAQKSDLENEILVIEIGDKAKLIQRNNLTDLALYNNYLNSAFLTEKKKGNEFAHNRLKSESDLMSKFNPALRIEVGTYRNRINSAIQKHDLEINNKQLLISVLQNQIFEISAKIKELHNQLRFYESRVLKYEALLLSV